MIDAGEIGEPQMLRLHVNTGKSDTAWKVPLTSWLWRIDDEKNGGGPLIFDHGYHLFSLAAHISARESIEVRPDAVSGGSPL